MSEEGRGGWIRHRRGYIRIRVRGEALDERHQIERLRQRERGKEERR